MNFMQNQTKSANQTNWPMIVALIFTLASYAPRSLFRQLVDEGIGIEQQHRECGRDRGERVQQARYDEHLDLQRRDHLRLARRALEEAAAQDAEADGGTECSHA